MDQQANQVQVYPLVDVDTEPAQLQSVAAQVTLLQANVAWGEVILLLVAVRFQDDCFAHVPDHFDSQQVDPNPSNTSCFDQIS